MADRYTIRRNPEGGFIWNPPKGSPQLRNALDRKYPDIIEYRDQMREALHEFESKEKSSRSPAQSLVTEHATLNDDSYLTHNASDPSLGQTTKRGRRKGPLSKKGRENFKKSYGKACKLHKKSRRQASFTDNHLRMSIDICSAIRKPAGIGYPMTSRPAT